MSCSVYTPCKPYFLLYKSVILGGFNCKDVHVLCVLSLIATPTHYYIEAKNRAVFLNAALALNQGLTGCLLLDVSDLSNGQESIAAHQMTLSRQQGYNIANVSKGKDFVLL